LAVGEDQSPGETVEPSNRWQDPLYYGVVELIHALGRTFELGYPREHVTPPFPLASSATEVFQPQHDYTRRSPRIPCRAKKA
jgi:hypothetical protein